MVGSKAALQVMVVSFCGHPSVKSAAKGAISGRDSELTIHQAAPISPQAFDFLCLEV